jgi:DNA transformation protein
MAVKNHKDASFVEYLLDALSALPGLRSKSMFGGFGLQSEDAFFGIVWNGSAYFKVDDATRPKYVELGSEPFTYSRDGKQMSMGYYVVPANVIEDHEQLLAWAQEAIGVARNARTTRVARPERKLTSKVAAKKKRA